MILKKAIIKNESLVNEMDYLLNDKNQVHTWWLGQSGFLIQWKGKRVLIDPYLSDALTKKYANTGKPHIRMSEIVIDPSLLKNISIVTSSHNHTDHLDADTLLPIFKNNPGIKFIIPEANRVFVTNRLHCEFNFPVGLNDEQSVLIDGFTFHGIPARHNEIERDANGNCKYMGFVIKFGDYTIYHSGDTIWDESIIEQLQPFSIDIAMLPINGNDPQRNVAGNLDAVEAIKLAKLLGVKYVIPCHYDMFTFNTAEVDYFEKEAIRHNQPYRVLNGGGRFDY